MEAKQKSGRAVVRNILLFALAVAIAYLIASSQIFEDLLHGLAPVGFVAELIAGGLYTSLITIPVSVSLLSVLAQEGNIYFIAAVGGAGATLGDYAIMHIFKRTARNVNIRSDRWDRLRKRRAFRYLLTLLGLVCLAAPVPDEIAMGILGVTHISTRNFVLLVYPAKALGLLAILTSLQALQ